MNEVFPATFYAATARPAPLRRALAHDVETEVCVIGGGFAGLWTARALLARGQEVGKAGRGAKFVERTVTPLVVDEREILRG